MIGTINLSDEEFTLISNLVYEKFGIKLGEKKRTLIIGRLQKELHLGGFNSFKEYYNYVLKEKTGRALQTLADKISTNHTYFFREKEHFDFFLTIILPKIAENLNKNKRGIRIWSAGCSSGEEPYTLAMLVSEYFGSEVSKIDIGILATDISLNALEKAAAGIYPAENIAQVPPVYRKKYFNPLEDGSWIAKQNLKNIITFRRLNLIRPDYPFRGLFQVIFCRNVMIYFDKITQSALIKRFYYYTEPGGYLFIGHSETIDRSSGLYQYLRPSVYQKSDKVGGSPRLTAHHL